MHGGHLVCTLRLLSSPENTVLILVLFGPFLSCFVRMGLETIWPFGASISGNQTLFDLSYKYAQDGYNST